MSKVSSIIVLRVLSGRAQSMVLLRFLASSAIIFALHKYLSSPWDSSLLYATVYLFSVD